MVSVIVPCRGHAHLLDRCLEALATQRGAPPFEVVVVDASGNGELRQLCGRRAGVRIVESDDGLVPGAARNRGAARARGELLAFTDADCVPDSNWVDALARALRGGARLVGGPVLDAAPRRPVSCADNLLQFAELPATRPRGPATHFPTCNAALRATDFEATGGFVEWRLGEDILLCEAVSRRWGDRALLFEPTMRVRHLGRTKLRELATHQHLLGVWRGRLRLRVGELQTRLGRTTLAIPAFAMWRYAYILRRTAQWHAPGLPRALVLSPILLFGLVAWCVGFRDGIRRGAPGGRPARWIRSGSA